MYKNKEDYTMMLVHRNVATQLKEISPKLSYSKLVQGLIDENKMLKIDLRLLKMQINKGG